MVEAFCYWLMQSLGHRKLCFDWAFSRGIQLDSFEGWFWRPWWKPGTYREQRRGYRFSGYGVDK